MIILIVCITIALTSVLICLLRYFTIERTPQETDEKTTADSIDINQPEQRDQQEIIDLVDYFGQTGAITPPPEAQHNADMKRQEETETQSDSEDETNPESVEEETNEKQASESGIGEENINLADSSDSFDPLSELQTGRAYLISCQKMLNQMRKERIPCAAVCFDFDRFRFINNLKGYAIGDYCLTQMGHAMEDIFPRGALCTRLSADHFAAVFPLTDGVGFEEYSENLRRVCEKIRSDVGLKSGLRTCMGYMVATMDRDYDITVLLSKANIARHCIKISKYENVEGFDDTMLTTYLYGESAVENYNEYQYENDFVLYYQGIQDLLKNRMIAGEALARWSCEDDVNRGAVPITSDSGKLPTNNCKVLYHTCKAMSRWKKMGKEVLPIYINLPATDLFKEDIDELFVRCMTEFQLEPKMLGVIIHASIVRTDWTLASRQVKKLKDLGMQVGVDGIDTGFQDIDFLGGLQIDFIKLHRGFLYKIASSPEREKKVRSILSMAGKFNLRTIFEGVDFFDIMQKLIDLEVREVQGKAVGIPEPPEEYQRGLPDYVEKKRDPGTVILDDYAFQHGDYRLY